MPRSRSHLCQRDGRSPSPATTEKKVLKTQENKTERESGAHGLERILQGNMIALTLANSLTRHQNVHSLDFSGH